MRELKLENSSLLVMVDDEDYERLRQFKWYNYTNASIYRAYTIYGQVTITGNPRTTHISMPNEIFGTIKKRYDHKDRNFLNNQRKNLRLCTQSQNIANRLKCHKSKSIHKGVIWRKSHPNVYCAAIRANGKRIHLGTFKTELEAAIAYNNAALKYYGEFAVLNKV